MLETFDQTPYKISQLWCPWATPELSPSCPCFIALAVRCGWHCTLRCTIKIIFRQRCPPSKVILHQRLSSIKGRPPSTRLPSKDVFHQRLSSIKGCLPSKIASHQRLSSTKGCLLSKVVFHQRLSSIKGHLPSKVVFDQRSSSINGRLPLVFYWA